MHRKELQGKLWSTKKKGLAKKTTGLKFHYRILIPLLGKCKSSKVINLCFGKNSLKRTPLLPKGSPRDKGLLFWTWLLFGRSQSWIWKGPLRQMGQLGWRRTKKTSRKSLWTCQDWQNQRENNIITKDSCSFHLSAKNDSFSMSFFALKQLPFIDFCHFYMFSLG